MRYPSRRGRRRRPRASAGRRATSQDAARRAAARAASSKDESGRGRAARPWSRPAASRWCSAFPAGSSVAANEGAKSFRIATATIAPDLLVRTRCRRSTRPPSSKPPSSRPRRRRCCPAGSRSIATASSSGRGQMALTPKDETVRLGFGVDDKVKVARTDGAQDTRARPASSPRPRPTSASSRSRCATATIRPIRVAVEDQLPVSEIDDIKVEMLPSTTPPTERDMRNRRGVMAWSFDAPPGRAARDQARLAGALAGRQDGGLRAGAVIGSWSLRAKRSNPVSLAHACVAEIASSLRSSQ